MKNILLPFEWLFLGIAQIIVFIGFCFGWIAEQINRYREKL